MHNKGNYYKLKTKKFFENKGYDCEYLEKLQRIYSKGKVMYIKKDLFGCDGLAMNKEHLVFWQCKLNRGHISHAIKEFHKYKYPKGPSIDRWIIVWTPRKRDPEIIEV